ncbi:hypothetical protein KSD_69680 [Ktedonobacter sp. SOSP1-85]|uniref:hypothetical protein n=1 Tax=Ktedonobacter sp. SOSP1-85 TaxID=2778367 RepID=UPI001916911C|nr:hypothetical protein [Ktedonobacter sp. SOSP1-85]GHO79197.1 hypothetical protein KSD_69680 [Ktedonobacter sp. SOSP1-85]
MQTNLNPVSETDLQVRIQRIQGNLQMMQRYFDALFGKDLNPLLEMIDDAIEWLVVPTGNGGQSSYAFGLMRVARGWCRSE